MKKSISYMGESSFRGHVYPIINRNLIAALEKDYEVVNNLHNLPDHTLTDTLIAHEYPLIPPKIKHPHNICLTAWEFAGNYCFPLRKIEVVEQYDCLVVPSRWVKQEIENQLTIPVKSIHWGLDLHEYKRYKNKVHPFTKHKDKIYLLWVGGTDKRHGLDIAVEIIRQLPAHYHLIIKQNRYYPLQEIDHERCTVLYDDLPSLYPLYNVADIFLQTARGVGFSLPTLEALAAGLPVVSSYLPPLQEFQTDRIYMGLSGQWQETIHHIYDDCKPFWFEPDVRELVGLVQQIPVDRVIPSSEFFDYYSWPTVAKELQDVCAGLL